MLSLLVNLDDGSTQAFPFDEWRSWAAHVESGHATGYSLKNGATSIRLKPPKGFKRHSAIVESLTKDGELKGVCVRQFAGNVTSTITLYASGVVVSGIEQDTRRVV